MNTHFFSSLVNRLKLLDFDNPCQQSDALKQYLDYYSLPVVLHYNAGFIETCNYQIFAQYWLPEQSKGTIFIVHGYLDHAGLYHHLIRFFLENSYCVFIFDLPGHGLSSGVRTAIDDFSDYSKIFVNCLSWAKNKLPKHWYLFGQSTGGAIITNSLLFEDTGSYEIQGVVLFAPLVRITYWRSIKMLLYLIKPFVSKVKRSFSINSNNSDFMDFIKTKDPLQSGEISLNWLSALFRWNKRILNCNRKINIFSLIFQGEKDRTVDWRFNIPFLNNLYIKSNIVYLGTARHHLANESEQNREICFKSIEKWLDPTDLKR